MERYNFLNPRQKWISWYLNHWFCSCIYVGWVWGPLWIPGEPCQGWSESGGLMLWGFHQVLLISLLLNSSMRSVFSKDLDLIDVLDIRNNWFSISWFLTEYFLKYKKNTNLFQHNFSVIYKKTPKNPFTGFGWKVVLDFSTYF